MIKAFADACDVAAAEHCMSGMLKAGVEANAMRYNTVMKACADTYEVSRAEHWMFMMLTAGQQVLMQTSSATTL